MSCLNDEAIGPAVRGCRGDFDFTFQFETIFLTILPDALFFCAALTTTILVWRRSRIVTGSQLRLAKIIVGSCYSGLSVGILILASRNLGEDYRELAIFAIPGLSLRVLAAILLNLLSCIHHSRAPRPSKTIAVYLSVTLLFDIAKVRTLWMLTNTWVSRAHALLATLATALKAIVILVESRQKNKWLSWDPEKHSPEETSGLYGLSVFLWLYRLFRQGYSSLLSIENLYPLDVSLRSAAVNERFIQHLQDHSRREKRYGLTISLAKFLSWHMLPPIIPRIVLVAASLCQPLLIDTLLDYLTSETRDRNHGYGLIAAAALTYSVIAISTALYWYFQERFIVLVRSCLVSAIYMKTTELDSTKLDDAKAVTLMSTDVERVMSGMLDLHEYWANALQIGVTCWLLYLKLSAAFVTPLIIVGVSCLAAFLIGKLMGPRQRTWMEAIERRVSVTSNAIAKMKSMKMAGIVLQVQENIQKLRLQELEVGGKWRMLLAAAATISQVPMVISPAITFAVATRRLDSNVIFVSVSYITLLAQPLTSLFQKLPQTLGALTCLERMQQFLDAEARRDPRSFTVHQVSHAGHAIVHVDNYEMDSLNGSSPPSIIISNGSFGWKQDKRVLQNVNLTINQGETVAIVGPVGSGKSTLCKALIGEVPVCTGDIRASHSRSIGYCDQQPFLINASIRQNITGFGPLDPALYGTILEATMLDVDMLTFPDGDSTVIGNDGIALSGGQRQRLSIARALYLHGTNLFILDDVFSGLDAKTTRHLNEHVLGPKGFLSKRGATVVLSTHNPQHIALADRIIRIQPNGFVSEEQRKPSEFGELPPIRNETMETAPAPDRISRSLEPQRSPLATEDSQARRMGDLSVYRQYFRTVGVVPLATFLFAGACNGFLTNFPRVWLTFWSDDVRRAEQGLASSHTQSYYVGIFGFFQTAWLLSFIVAGVLVLKTFIQSSGSELHRQILDAVVNAPLRLFTKTDAGTITNYFSQDMTLIDGQLPIALVNLGMDAFAVIGMAAVLASSAPWLALAYPPMLAVLWCIQKFYLRTSRQLRLLDLEAKAPLYAHFLETLKGAATLRALGWTSTNVYHNRDLLDDSQRPLYLLAMVQRWLFLALSIIVAATATISVACMTQMSTSATLSGASLVTLMSLGQSLSDIIRFYAGLETSIGAVARLRSFTAHTGREGRLSGLHEPEESWPSQGAVIMNGVWVTYNEEDSADFALQNIRLTIQPGERVAICGRTGSGKSSLILVLLGLVEPSFQDSSAYELTVDGISISSVRREALRERLVTIPQEPVFLPSGGTVAQNLDPAEKATEQDLDDLQQTLSGLRNIIDGMGGLRAEFCESNLSHGQRQLFSLARAVLKRRLQHGTVLLLDEFASSVDDETERAMMEVIETEFSNCTIIMVAHRLKVVQEFCTRVLAMNKGKIVEDGNPRALAAMNESWFGTLLMAIDSPAEAS